MRIIVSLAFFSQWPGNVLFSYSLDEIFDPTGTISPTIQLLINGIPAIWDRALLAPSPIDKRGRRFLFLTSCKGTFFFFLAQTNCIQQYQAAYDLAFIPLIVSCLRAKGFNNFNFVMSLALIFNQYVDPIAPGMLKWKYCIVYAGWLTFEGVFIASTSSKRRTSPSKRMLCCSLAKRPSSGSSRSHISPAAEGKNVGTHEMKKDIDEKGGDRHLPPELSHVQVVLTLDSDKPYRSGVEICAVSHFSGAAESG